MPTEVVTITGLKELDSVLKELGKRVVLKVTEKALLDGASVIAAAARRNAERILREAEGRGYKRKRGWHLFKTIGTRVRTYSAEGTVFVAAGPLYPIGAHGHLVEFGHRVVVGGSMRSLTDPGRLLAMTAVGKRTLKAFGFKQKRKGSQKWIATGGGRRWIAGHGWSQESYVEGEQLKFSGEFAFGRRIRGGGRVVAGRGGGGAGRTQPRRFMAPAFDATKSAALSIIVQRHTAMLEKEAVALAREKGAI